MKKNKYSVFRLILLAVLLAGVAELAYNGYLSYKNKKNTEKLAETVALQEETESAAAVSEEPAEQAILEGETEKEETESEEDIFLENMLPQYRELYQTNSDLVGWITVEDTEINYPLVRSEDNEYYLSHVFYGEESKYGCLYVKNFVDINEPGSNFVVYGHNMRDGSMFGGLKKFADREYYKEHPIIKLDTLFESREYEILAAFYSKVYAEDYEGIKYYEFYDAASEEEFDAFINSFAKLRQYDTGVSAKYGDQLITLSTCSSHTEDGRFVVVAKRK